MHKLFLLDAYALIYRAYYAFIKNPRINSQGLNTSAILGFVNTLEEVLRTEQPTHIGVAFDPSGPTFRHEAYPEYKAQREATPEAIRNAVPYIKRLLEAYRIPVLEVPGYEADDVIGTLATQAHKRQGTETFMMTPDKDYGQLVTERVRMFRPGRGDKDFEVLGVAEVCAKYGLQTPTQVIDMLGLMGDASDNIPGCPGVGEKTAVRLIQEFGSIEALLERTHELKGALKTKIEDHREQITFSKFLATIKTDVPIALDLEALQLTPPDEEALQTLFEELEFRSLLSRRTKTEAPAAPKGPVQRSLFDDMEDSLFASPTPQAEAPSASSTLADYTTTNPSYHLIRTPEERQALIARLLAADTLCLDTETTGTHAIDAQLVGVSFSVQENEAYYIPFPPDQAEAQQLADELRPVYENEQSLKVGQNLKYDLQVLASYGIRLQGRLFDTMIAHYLLKPELHHGMDYLAETYLHYRPIPIEALIGPKGKGQKNMRDLSPEDVYIYACEDADVTLKLMHVLQPMLQAEEGCEALFHDIEMPLVSVLARMERNGVCIDVQALTESSTLYTARMQTLEAEIHQLAGGEFNVSSPKQVGEVLFDRLKIVEKPKKTKTGQYVTSEEVLESLRHKHEIVEKILAHRGLKKLLSTYIDALPKLVNPRTGHIHTSFNQTVTATGRLSSSAPNLQNIPVRGAEGKEIRKAFVPEPGCEFFSADYSQIELRIMAHLSGDENLMEAFRSGHDIHAATAAKIFKKADIADVTADERRKAKTANFGIIYGITTFGLAERMGVSRGEAKTLIDDYFATYPRVKEYMDESIRRAHELGYTETICHRRCHLPDIHSANAVVRGYAERNAINAPIQGSAADIIKIAMSRICARMEAEALHSKMILQVHDELNFSVLPEERDTVQRIVIEEMERAAELQVPLVADYGWGKNWLEAH